MTDCKHPAPNLIPYEYEFGQKFLDKEYNKTKFSWHSVASQAHVVRVKTMYCLKCNKVIELKDPRL
jgi:hypothetical protein